MRVAVLIVAAGRGRRFGSDVPKQYVKVAGMSVLRRTLTQFLNMTEVHVIQTVIHPDDREMYTAAVQGIADGRVLPPAYGGETRAASVLNGLEALADHPPDCVLVHDAARPFVTVKIVQDVIEALHQGEAAFAALPVVDALWRADTDGAIAPVSREGLWRAQTPQGFRFQTLKDAHHSYVGDAADDVEIVRAMGMPVRIVTGHADNFKITSPDDLARAERIVAAQENCDTSEEQR